MAIIIGRKTANPDFDALMVGQRCIRTMSEGLKRLNAKPPAYDGGMPSLAVIATVDALEYLRFRFADAAWMPKVEALDRLLQATADRSSIVETRPR